MSQLNIYSLPLLSTKTKPQKIKIEKIKTQMNPSSQMDKGCLYESLSKSKKRTNQKQSNRYNKEKRVQQMKTKIYIDLRKKDIKNLLQNHKNRIKSQSKQRLLTYKTNDYTNVMFIKNRIAHKKIKKKNLSIPYLKYQDIVKTHHKNINSQKAFQLVDFTNQSLPKTLSISQQTENNGMNLNKKQIIKNNQTFLKKLSNPIRKTESLFKNFGDQILKQQKKLGRSSQNGLQLIEISSPIYPIHQRKKSENRQRLQIFETNRQRANKLLKIKQKVKPSSSLNYVQVRSIYKINDHQYQHDNLDGISPWNPDQI